MALPNFISKKINTSALWHKASNLEGVCIVERTSLIMYASIVTALFMAAPATSVDVNEPPETAVLMDDVVADVWLPADYILYVIGCDNEVEVLPTGQNVLHLEDQNILLDEGDGNANTHGYDQFVWTWEEGEPECQFGFLWVLDTNASGSGIAAP